MSVYDIYGNELFEVYDLDNNSLNEAYDIEGRIVFDSGGYLPDRILVFEDDFHDGENIADRWTYEIGYCRNNEPQHYRPENIFIQDDRLVIRAVREHYPGDTVRNSTWTSGSITSQNHFKAFYGRWQIRAKLPKISGSWFAFWLLSGALEFVYTDDGNQCRNMGPVTWWNGGEIDIDESFPGNGNQMKTNVLSKNPIYEGNPISNLSTGPVIDFSEWNVYEIEWTETYIAALCNGIEFHRYDLNSEERDFSFYKLSTTLNIQGMFMIIDQAIGGISGQVPDDVDQMDCEIDWIRVYAPIGYTMDKVYPSSISLSGPSLVNVGNYIDIDIAYTPYDVFDRSVIWDSSDDSIATVHCGRVRGLTEGTVTITATTNNGCVASHTIQVVT